MSRALYTGSSASPLKGLYVCEAGCILHEFQHLKKGDFLSAWKSCFFFCVSRSKRRAKTGTAHDENPNPTEFLSSVVTCWYCTRASHGRRWPLGVERQPVRPPAAVHFHADNPEVGCQVLQDKHPERVPRGIAVHQHLPTAGFYDYYYFIGNIGELVVNRCYALNIISWHVFGLHL